jgi:hypothetical protein
MTNPLRRETSTPPSVHAVAAARPEADVVIRPAAVIPETAARELRAWLDGNSLEHGGLWSVGAATGIWQRYDRAWNGPFGSRGDSQLVGTIYVTYNMPRRHEVVVHRVQVADHGLMLGWTTTRLVDELLAKVGLSIATCPRDTTLPAQHAKDPFQRPDERLSEQAPKLLG